jgi:branched-chain amino acid transport system substrate-binding protein
MTDREAHEDGFGTPLTRRSVMSRSAAATASLLAMGGLGSLLEACGGADVHSSASSASGDGTTGTTTGVTDKTIKIGCTSGNTGAYALAGSQFAGFMKRAFDKINAEGGVYGRKIELVTLDDGGDAQRALSNIQQLVRQDQVFALTPAGTGTVAGALDFIMQEKVPLVFPNAFFDALVTPPKSGVYAMWPLYDTQVAAITKWAYAKYGSGTAAIVRADLPVWDTSEAAVRKVVQAGGGKVLTVLNTTYTQPEWGSTVISLKKADPDYLIVITSAVAEAGLWKEMANQGWSPKKGKTLGTETLIDQAFLAAAGDIPDGSVFGACPGTVLPTDAAAAQVQALWPDEKMGLYGLEGGQAGQAWASLLKTVGKDLTRERLVKVLETGFGPTKLPYTFTMKSAPTHVIDPQIGVGTVTGGKLVLAQTAGVSA